MPERFDERSAVDVVFPILVCAWCGDQSDEENVPTAEHATLAVSHGICGDCFDTQPEPAAA